jgi:hypothetical protein
VTVSICAAIVSALLDLGVGAVYCAKVLRKEARPRITTWIIFEIGVGMSLTAYFSSQDHSALKAVLNLADAVIVTAILAGLLIEGRSKRIVFTANERLCLLTSCITLAVWGVTKTAWIGVAGFQLVMVLAYIPTIENLWRWHTGRAPEPVETWSMNAVAALMGVIVDVTGGRRDYLAMLYPLRAFLFCVIVVALIQRWKYRDRLIHASSDRGTGAGF